MEFKNLKSKDIPAIRKQILEEQGYHCPLCGKPLSDKDRITLDHQHKYRKSDDNIVDGNGLVRGVLCADCNVIEGRLHNAMARFMHQPDRSQRIQWVKNLAEYYQKDFYPYVHPTEVKKEPMLSKRNFNKLNKLYKDKYNKVLIYPKSGKMTKQLKPLYEEFNVQPYF